MNNMVFAQIEVDQNNDVNLRSGEAIIKDNSINLRSGEMFLGNNKVEFAPTSNSRILLEEELYKVSFGPYGSLNNKRPSLVPYKTGFVGGLLGTNGAIGRSQKRWSDIYTWDLFYTNLYSASDSNFKKEVAPVSNGLNQIMNLNPVKFHYNATYYNQFSPDSVQVNPDSIKNRLQRGFIAQQVNEIIPETVLHRENLQDSTSSYVLSQEDLVPVLTNAVQDQQGMIEQLQMQVDSLQQQVNCLRENSNECD